MKFAFIFPGQGSQALGMLNDFMTRAVVRETLEEASQYLGYDVAKLIQNGPIEQLNSTVYTQPVMLSASYAMYCLWLAEGGPIPSIVAGHSLGEYTALVAAKTLTFSDALPLVTFRAKVMQEAVPIGVGGMAALLGLDDDQVREVCAEAATFGVVEAVNFNAPAQVVIAGVKSALEKACEIAKAKGAKRALMLSVSAPFHSSLLTRASEQLGEYLANIKLSSPLIPVINNVDVAILSNVDSIKDALTRQAASPVRWVECINKIASNGAEIVIESGPGKVLTGLSKRINVNLKSGALTDLVTLEEMLKAVQ